MKNLFLISLLFIATISSNAQVKVGNNPNSINANSILELESTNKGLLISRFALNSVSSVSPLTGTVPAGMLVYSSGGTLTDGFYYWNGTTWLSLLTQNNTFINNGNSFATIARLGTNDNHSVAIETYNTERMRIDSLGNVGIGTTVPRSTLQITGSISLPVVTKTSTYTATANDYLILCNVNSMTVNLPQASVVAGRIYVIKKIFPGNGGTITITPYSGDNIDGQSTNTWVSGRYQSITIQSDGTNWFVISEI